MQILSQPYSAKGLEELDKTKKIGQTLQKLNGGMRVCGTLKGSKIAEIGQSWTNFVQKYKNSLSQNENRVQRLDNR